MNNVVFYRYLSNYKDEVEFEHFKTDSYWESEVEFFKERKVYLFSVLEEFNIITNKADINFVDDFTLVIGFDPSFRNLFDLIYREDFNKIINDYGDKIKKIVFWEMDTDWTNYSQSEYDEANGKFKQYFYERGIEYKVFSTVMSFKYDTSVGYFAAQNAMTIERLIRVLTDSGYYELNENCEKQKYFYSAANSLNVDRAHYYKFIDDNNLWDKNNIALFATFRNTDYQYGFNYSKIVSLRGTGGLDTIDDEYLFYSKPFEDEEFVTMDYELLTNHGRYASSVFEMVFETMYESNENLIIQTSEKILKPLAQKKAFMTFSYCGMLNELKKLGFKTFDYIFDEGYDTLRGANSRLYDIMDEYKRICSKDISQLSQIVKENKDVQEHNFIMINKLMKKWRDDFKNAVTYE